MYSCEQEQNTSYLRPCAAGRSLQQLSAHHQRGQADPVVHVQVQQPQQPRRAAGKKKPGARPPSRRSSTTVVATDVANFRAMVQELTGFPPAAIFRPLPRRVHAAVSNPAFALPASGFGHQFQGDARGQGLETTMNTSVSSLGRDAPAVQPVGAPPPGVFDGLSDIGSPVFDSWADLSIE
ncbi:hypothetical protein PR202_ga02778 [Eleusine coracana subsp. coracana]|uniref:VQ domain-containing protein n=1 Tax=Eleusine coracana subsp. coracana TaxID=191504 RepID=A0AAV5BKC9_ELECO|nr:hypothetical protein QOZ80_2AG0146150 [Eleusine coracana subsp. coracana]GJM86879.1 hypothetical protein PR202_ga02778 [Eleusine coracana subsp. coracana]